MKQLRCAKFGPAFIAGTLFIGCNAILGNDDGVLVVPGEAGALPGPMEAGPRGAAGAPDGNAGPAGGAAGSVGRAGSPAAVMGNGSAGAPPPAARDGSAGAASGSVDASIDRQSSVIAGSGGAGGEAGRAADGSVDSSVSMQSQDAAAPIPDVSTPTTCSTDASCGPAAPVCLGGRCVACRPEATTCVGDRRSDCDAFGQWVTAAATCAATNGTTCCDGVCRDLVNSREACGSCSNNCGAQVCRDRRCSITLLPYQRCYPNSVCHDGFMKLDATHIYFASNGLRIANLSDGVLAPLEVTTYPDVFEVRGSALFWGNTFGPAPIYTRDLAATVASVVVSNVQSLWFLSTNPTGLFWLEDTNTVFMEPVLTRLMKAGLSATGTVLASDLGEVIGLASDATRVYWASAAPSQVRSVSVNGGTPAVLATPVDAPAHMTTDATNLYWCDARGGIFRVGLAGGTVQRFTAVSQPCNAIAVRSGALFSTSTTGVFKIDLSTDRQVPLSEGYLNPSAVVANDTDVYFMEGQYLFRVPR